ncbi:MAG: carbamoyltransferase HypF [Gammaproteobacteria bacterium]|nr:carbamoyltransferase HypF [Gammaproteobacteria bacterium]
MTIEVIDLVLTGRVQGVGFRPFVYRLAHEHNIHGWVRNTVGRVEIHAEGAQEQLDSFRHALIQDSPPLAEPQIEYERPGVSEDKKGFFIMRSEADGEAQIHTPPDQYLCPDCEAELHDPDNRRYRYPFINCTQCGPRYTIINAMPYDRANTSMDEFPLCPPCHEEYESPDNRRFHAEPNACADCGPHLSYFEPDVAIEGDSEAALDMAVTALQRGRILAVKGVGGYHLMCDAANELAVARLRKNKHRPHKPLALMVPAVGEDGLDAVRKLVDLENEQVARDLLSQSRPIILLKKTPHAPVCEEVAPGLDELGVMLPPSPMHVLLLEAFGRAVVATSGNISGEPVLTDDEEADRRLGKIAEGWLIHNRKIVRPADDAVKRMLNGKPRMIRLGRGSAPLELKLPIKLQQPVLAVGGHLKNTVALAWENRAVISPHIGELTAHRSLQVFQQVIDDLQRLYQVEATAIVCDAHPQYASTRWAFEQKLPVYQVQHHKAHASSLAGDCSQNPEQLNDKGLVFTWDGVGYGEDGKLWGGEAFLGTPADWQHVATFRSFHFTGGDRVAHEPWRSAAALYWELEEIYPGSEAERLAHVAWQSGLNKFETSAVGRLFDAAAATMELVHTTSHEGEAPMRLEAIAEDVETQDSLPFEQDDGLLRIDWEPLFYAMKSRQHSAAHRAGYLHALLANTVVEIAKYFSDKDRIDYVGLSGGVFQNRRLTEMVNKQLQETGIACRLHENIPANDGGISYGQVIEYAARYASTN